MAAAGMRRAGGVRKPYNSRPPHGGGLDEQTQLSGRTQDWIKLGGKVILTLRDDEDCGLPALPCRPMMRTTHDPCKPGATHDSSCDPADRPSLPSALVPDPLCPGPDRDRARGPHRVFLSRSWKTTEAARRRLHRADQDDDRAGDLLHRGARHLLDGRPQTSWPGGAEVAGLFRDGLDGRACG